MASRCALGAALVGLGVARAHRPSPLASNDNLPVAPVPPPPPPLGDGSEIPASRAKHVDLARAIAIMEKYQRMSREALEVNDSGMVEKRSGSAETSLARKSDEAMDGLLEDGKGANIEEGRTVQPAAVEKKGEKKRRIPSSTFFEDLELTDADICVPYVVVGGGTAAWSAIQAIRKRNQTAIILLVTEESAYPYNRTPLSKELWSPSSAGLFTSEACTRDAIEYSYAAPGGDGSDHFSAVSIIRGKPVVSLDIDAKTVSIEGGHVIQYNKLLLATGGSPRSAESVCGALSAQEVAENVSVFRTVDDFRALRERLGAPDSHVAVVGGGFLGTELAVAMACEGRRVSLLCAEPGVLYKVLPRYLSQFLSKRLEAVGVSVVESVVVTDAALVDGNKVKLEVGAGVDKSEIDPVDKVVVATGLVPRVELAAGAGLEIDQKNGGVVVNDQMNAEADVWVAGDVASFWDRALGRRRVEHWDHAVVSGRIAGDRMAGGNSRYGLQSMFWSDLENVGVTFEAVGHVEHSLETVAFWNLRSPAYVHAPSSSSYTEGVVWYLRNDVVVGAVLWNLRGSKPLAEARRAISSKLKIRSDEDLTGVIDLPDSPHSVVVRTEAETDVYTS